MKIVIIGGGAAGTACAARLRRLNENDEIIILEKSNQLALSNCGLPHLLSGVVKNGNNLIGTTPEKMKQRYNIDCRLNTEVDSINRKDKTVTTLTKEVEDYDKLIIATGAYQLRPDVEGILGEQIFTIRDLESITKIKEFIKSNQVKNAVIMGGGFIGVEIAESLIKLGIKVTLVEASNHLLPSLDYDMAASVHNYLREKGLSVYLKRKITAFGDDKITMDNGQTIAYDMGIIATGVQPDLKIAIMADLEIGEDGGIKVNEHMQTSDKDIYAIGDNVEVLDYITRKPTRMAQAGLAVKQAKVAADNLGEISSKFKFALGTSIIKIFDYTAAAVGANEAKLKAHNIAYQQINLYDFDHASYMPDNELILLKILFSNSGDILGAQAVGKGNVNKKIDILALAIQANTHASELENTEFTYAPQFSAGKDSINNLGSMAYNVLGKRIKLISYAEIDWDNITDETMLIDIRDPKDFDQEHIEKAINIPLTALRHNLDSIPHDKKVILYCRYGVGSYVASRILENRGFDNIYVLNGGMELYNEIIRDEAETEALENS